jgi:hypothetical protein
VGAGPLQFQDAEQIEEGNAGYRGSCSRGPSFFHACSGNAFSIAFCKNSNPATMLQIQQDKIDIPTKMKYMTIKSQLVAAVVFSGGFMVASTSVAEEINGRIIGAGKPVAKAEVTLWESTSGDPRKVSETQTGSDGGFELSFSGKASESGVYYLISKGGVAKQGAESNAAITLMATLGSEPPERVTVNELTTIASAYTGSQFLDNGALRGNAKGLRIAAGNVPNLVDLETGGQGPVIVNVLNGPRTTR